MERNAIVILFPEEEFLGTRRVCIPLFNDCITKRYLINNYELVAVRYSGYRGSYTGGILYTPIERIIDADITSDQQLTQYANFENIANEITKKEYNNIVIGGFHCFDCVEKLAKEVYNINKNTIIDSDLTEQFDFVSKYYKDWDLHHFKPELKIEESRRSFNHTSAEMLKRIADRYTHPVWGIPPRYIESLQEDKDQSDYLEQDMKS